MENYNIPHSQYAEISFLKLKSLMKERQNKVYFHIIGNALCVFVFQISSSFSGWDL